MHTPYHLLNFVQILRAITVRYQASRSTTCIDIARGLWSMINARWHTLEVVFPEPLEPRVGPSMESLRNFQYHFLYKSGAMNTKNLHYCSPFLLVVPLLYSRLHPDSRSVVIRAFTISSAQLVQSVSNQCCTKL